MKTTVVTGVFRRESRGEFNGKSLTNCYGSKQ